MNETLNYPLNADSVVYDVGGYLGKWAADIIDLYNPNMVIFEPIQEFYDVLIDRFKSNPKVVVHKVGLSSQPSTVTFDKRGDATSLYLDGGVKEEIRMVDVQDFDREIDLISLNCEGGEFDILNRMLDTGMAGHCKYIQAQFHHGLSLLPGSKEKQVAIRERLQKTHTELYNTGYWESWKRNS